MADEAKAGDPAAATKLAEMMRPYLVSFLRNIPGVWTRDQRDEMTQVAYLGVWEALARWDTERGVKYTTYAMHWVRHEVYEWMAKNSRALPVPRQAWNFGRKLEEAYTGLHGPMADITRATDQELSEIEIPVVREGTPTTKNINYAGDIIRGKRAPYSLDPDDHDRETASAEDIFFAESDEAEEARTIRIANLMVDALAELRPEERKDALDFWVSDMGWPPEVAELLLELKEPAL